MPGEVTLTWKDYSGESSVTGFGTRTATNANFDAITGEISALLAALQGVTLGNIQRTRFVAQINDVTPGSAASPTAQREMKWLLQLEDDVTGEVIQREIPTADIATAGLLVPGTDQADITNAAWVAVKTAIEGNFKNPRTGNDITLIGAILVGRNL